MRTFSSISSLAFLLALGHCLPQGFEAERPAGDELAQSANPFTGIGGSGDFGDNGGGLQPTDIDFTGGFQPGQLATLAVFNEEEGVLEGTLLEGPDGSVTALDAAGRPLDFNAEGELVAPASGELQSFSSKSGELFAVSASALKGGTLADIWRFIKEYGTAAWNFIKCVGMSKAIKCGKEIVKCIGSKKLVKCLSKVPCDTRKMAVCAKKYF